MAIACPIDLDTLKLRAEIQSIYARVAADPSGEFHFHRGPEYAAERLGYDAAELSQIPRSVTESFAGVANPHAIAPLPQGATVIDIGSGAGTDLLLAAFHVGPEGLGLLYASMGAGALVAAVASGWTARVKRQGLTVLVAVTVWGLSIALFGILDLA